MRPTSVMPAGGAPERFVLHPGRRRPLSRLACGVVALAVVVSVGSVVHAQRREAPAGGHGAHDGPPGAPGGRMVGASTAASADVESPGTIVAAYYASLSGPAGTKRDRNRYLSLFLPGARLLPAEGKGHGGTMPHVFSPQTYLSNVEPQMIADGFVPREIGRRTDCFGKVVQVFSAYEVRRAAGDPNPFVRGIHSFQLFSDGRRWWIFSVVWQPETTGSMLPAEYLLPSGRESCPR